VKSRFKNSVYLKVNLEARGSIVVMALCYKLEGHGFKTR
jgi:hypothetical protein